MDPDKSSRVVGAAPSVLQKATRRNLEATTEPMAGKTTKSRLKQLPTGPEGLDDLAWDDATALTSVKYPKATTHNEAGAPAQSISDNDDEMI